MNAKVAIVAGAALVLLLVLTALAVQTYRLRATNSELTATAQERDDALRANEDLEGRARRAEEAARAREAALGKLRADYERRLTHARKIPDDGCLDRALPDAVRRLLTEGDPGGVVAACPVGT